MKKGLFIGAMLLFLSACTLIPPVAAVREVIKIEGPKAADSILEDAVWVICRGASIGSVSRYFKTRKLADAWLAICDPKNEASIFDAT